MMQLTQNTLGWSATCTSLLLNILTINGMELINNSYTILLSSMSVVYLYYKIKNERSKNNEKD
jgi:hypothetical protein